MEDHILAEQQEQDALAARLAAKKAEYWANRGKKQKARNVTLLLCEACQSSHGTFEYRGEGTQRRLVHVGCPGPKEPQD